MSFSEGLFVLDYKGGYKYPPKPGTHIYVSKPLD